MSRDDKLHVPCKRTLDQVFAHAVRIEKLFFEEDVLAEEDDVCSILHTLFSIIWKKDVQSWKDLKLYDMLKNALESMSILRTLSDISEKLPKTRVSVPSIALTRCVLGSREGVFHDLLKILWEVFRTIIGKSYPLTSKLLTYSHASVKGGLRYYFTREEIMKFAEIPSCIFKNEISNEVCSFTASEYEFTTPVVATEIQKKPRKTTKEPKKIPKDINKGKGKYTQNMMQSDWSSWNVNDWYSEAPVKPTKKKKEHDFPSEEESSVEEISSDEDEEAQMIDTENVEMTEKEDCSRQKQLENMFYKNVKGGYKKGKSSWWQPYPYTSYGFGGYSSSGNFLYPQMDDFSDWCSSRMEQNQVIIDEEDDMQPIDEGGKKKPNEGGDKDKPEKKDPCISSSTDKKEKGVAHESDCESDISEEDATKHDLVARQCDVCDLWKLETSFSALKWKIKKNRKCKRCLRHLPWQMARDAATEAARVEKLEADKAAAKEAAAKEKKKHGKRDRSSDDSNSSKSKRIKSLENEIKNLKKNNPPAKGKGDGKNLKGKDEEKGKGKGEWDVPWKGDGSWKGDTGFGWKGDYFGGWKGDTGGWKGGWKGDTGDWKGDGYWKGDWKGSGWSGKGDWDTYGGKGWKGDWDAYGAYKGDNPGIRLGRAKRRRSFDNNSGANSSDADLSDFDFCLDLDSHRRKKKLKYEVDQQKRIDTRKNELKDQKKDLTEQQMTALKKCVQDDTDTKEMKPLYTNEEGKLNIRLIGKNQKDLLSQAISTAFDVELNLLTKRDNKEAVATLVANNLLCDSTRLWNEAMLKEAIKSLKWEGSAPPGLCLKMTEVMSKRKVIFGGLKKIPSFSSSATAGLSLKTVLHVFDILENGTAHCAEMIPIPQVHNAGLTTPHLVLALITVICFFQKLKSPSSVKCFKTQDTLQSTLDLSDRYWSSNSALLKDKSIPSIIQTGMFLFFHREMWTIPHATLELTLPSFWWEVINSSLSDQQYKFTVNRKVATLLAQSSESCLEEGVLNAEQEKKLSFMRQPRQPYVPQKVKTDEDQTEVIPKGSFTKTMSGAKGEHGQQQEQQKGSSGGPTPRVTEQVYIPPPLLVKW